MLLIRVVTGQLSEMVDTRDYECPATTSSSFIQRDLSSHKGQLCNDNENNNSTEYSEVSKLHIVKFTRKFTVEKFTYLFFPC